MNSIVFFTHFASSDRENTCTNLKTLEFRKQQTNRWMETRGHLSKCSHDKKYLVRPFRIIKATKVWLSRRNFRSTVLYLRRSTAFDTEKSKKSKEKLLVRWQTDCYTFALYCMHVYYLQTFWNGTRHELSWEIINKMSISCFCFLSYMYARSSQFNPWIVHKNNILRNIALIIFLLNNTIFASQYLLLLCVLFIFSLEVHSEHVTLCLKTLLVSVQKAVESK